MDLRFRPLVTMLDRRDVPSVVATDDFTLTGAYGSASVTVTVTEQLDETYLWEYEVTNDDFLSPSEPDDLGVGMFIVPVVDSGVVTDVSNSAGWGGLADYDMVTWQGDEGSQLMPSASATFSFVTPAMPIGEAFAEVSDPGYAVVAGGDVLAPVRGAKVDFANATTGQAYHLRIKGFNAGAANPAENLVIQIGAAADAEDIAEAVKLALEGVGYSVQQKGTKLIIAPPAGRVSIWFQTQNTNGQDNNNLNGPAFSIGWPTYDVYVNGQKKN